MDMGKYSEKVVCITGADGGIGREITKKFAAEGATLILTSIADTPAFADFVNGLKNEYKVDVYPFCFDLSDEEAIKEGLKAIKALKLKINVLINNAGMPHLAILPFTKMSDVKKVFQVNYFAQLQITQSLLGIIVKDGSGCILNAASIAGIDGDMGNAVYGATKASMILLTKVLSKELAASKIRVNAVAPGLVPSTMNATLSAQGLAAFREDTPLGQLVTPEQVAEAVCYLAEAEMVTGQILSVDGGIVI